MYLSANAIAEMEGKYKTHSLNELAVRLDKSLGDAVGLQNIGVHIITVEPGFYSTEYHCHLIQDECVYVLSGSGEARIGSETFRIGPGDFIGCPANGEAHAMEAEGEEPLVCLVMGQRLSHDVTEYPDRQKRLYRTAGKLSLVNHSDIEPVKR